MQSNDPSPFLNWSRILVVVSASASSCCGPPFAPNMGSSSISPRKKCPQTKCIFPKCFEKGPIHIFLNDTFQCFRITIIYKGTQVTMSQEVLTVSNEAALWVAQPSGSLGVEAATSASLSSRLIRPCSAHPAAVDPQLWSHGEAECHLSRMLGNMFSADFHWTFISYNINEAHSLLDTIFNYISYFGPPAKHL